MKFLSAIPPGDGQQGRAASRPGPPDDTENYLLICPTHRDHRELSLLARGGANYIRHDYASLALEELTVIGSSTRPMIADPIEEI